MFIQCSVSFRILLCNWGIVAYSQPMRANVELTGATLPYRAVSRGRREQRFCRRLRNTVLAPAHSHDRQLDRQLLADYEQLLARVERELSPANHAAAIALASFLADIRGYGPVRERYAIQAGERRKTLWQDFTLGRQPGGNAVRGKALKIPVVSR